MNDARPTQVHTAPVYLHQTKRLAQNSDCTRVKSAIGHIAARISQTAGRAVSGCRRRMGMTASGSTFGSGNTRALCRERFSGVRTGK